MFTTLVEIVDDALATVTDDEIFYFTSLVLATTPFEADVTELSEGLVVTLFNVFNFFYYSLVSCIFLIFDIRSLLFYVYFFNYAVCALIAAIFA